MAELQKVERLMGATYLAVIRSSVGSGMFRSFYMHIGGKKVDVLNDGQLSCAFFVSSVLTIFGLIQRVHGTVDATIKDIEESGAKKVRKPRIGSVIVWGKSERIAKTHRHIGFYVGNQQAISNLDDCGSPQNHDWLFNGDRSLENIFWFPKIK